MADAPHGPLIFGVEDEGGGGGGPCVGVVPMTFGNSAIAATTVTRFLSPAGEMSGTTADTRPTVYVAQATGAVKRFQIRVRDGAGNGEDIEYEAMLLVAGVPTSFPDALIITLASTFAGLATITPPAGQVLVDGDEVIVEVRKALAVGSSPQDVQAFLQIEDECGGGGGGGSCCAPQYLHANQWNAYAFIYISGAGGTLDLDASLCGQDTPHTAVIRDSAFGPASTPPLVTLVGYDSNLNLLRVTWDNSGEDGQFVLEVTNGCGCCWLFPIEGVSV